MLILENDPPWWGSQNGRNVKEKGRKRKDEGKTERVNKNAKGKTATRAGEDTVNRLSAY
jgi:hypothetical protein